MTTLNLVGVRPHLVSEGVRLEVTPLEVDVSASAGGHPSAFLKAMHEFIDQQEITLIVRQLGGKQVYMWIDDVGLFRQPVGVFFKDWHEPIMGPFVICGPHPDSPEYEYDSPLSRDEVEGLVEKMAVNEGLANGTVQPWGAPPKPKREKCDKCGNKERELKPSPDRLPYRQLCSVCLQHVKSHYRMTAKQLYLIDLLRKGGRIEIVGEGPHKLWSVDSREPVTVGVTTYNKLASVGALIYDHEAKRYDISEKWK